MKRNIRLFILFFTLNLSAQDVIYVQPIIATKAFQGSFGTATLQIRDANEDGQITKPLIVAEGLDTGLLAQAGF